MSDILTIVQKIRGHINVLRCHGSHRSLQVAEDLEELSRELAALLSAPVETDDDQPPQMLPLECVNCRSATGPLHPLNADHAGWLCRECYVKVSGEENAGQLWDDCNSSAPVSDPPEPEYNHVPFKSSGTRKVKFTEGGPPEPRIIPDAIIPTGDDGDMPIVGPPGALKRKEQPESFQVGDVVRDIHSRQLHDVFAVDPGGSVQLIEGGCFWPREDYGLVHRPGRMIPESDVREAIADERAVKRYGDVAYIAGQVIDSIASRLGVELEDNGK